MKRLIRRYQQHKELGREVELQKIRAAYHDDIKRYQFLRDKAATDKEREALQSVIDCMALTLKEQING